MSIVNLLALLPIVAGLKLTPVQQLTQRIDLASESRSTASALTNAQSKFEQFEHSDADLRDFLESTEIQKLYAIIRRWTYIEEKLKFSMASGQSQQTQQFEDVQHNIASIKVLLGHSFYRKQDEKLALQELEQSCPVLWRLKASWRSIVHDGWLDCYSTLAQVFLQRGQLDDAKILSEKLLRSMPWIGLVLKLPQEETSLEVLKAFIALSLEDRKLLSVEIKGAWAFAEGIRGSFKVLMDEFMSSESSRKRQTIFARARKVTEEILQQYSSSSSSPSSGEIEASLSSLDLPLLQSKLREEIQKETDLFLAGMAGYIRSGEDYLKEMKQLDLSSSLKTSFETLSAVLEAGNDLSWAQMHASELSEDHTGFYDLGAVWSIFEQSSQRVKELKKKKLEESERAKRFSRAAKGSGRQTSTKGEKQRKQSRSNGNGNGDAQSFNETFGRRKYGQRVASEELSWTEYLLGCLWSLFLSSGLLSLVSVAGGHFLRSSSSAASKSPHSRPNRVFLKPKPPPNSITRRGASPVTSSLLVPAPRFEAIEESSESSSASSWWRVMLEDSRVFWQECYSLCCRLFRSLGSLLQTLLLYLKRRSEQQQQYHGKRRGQHGSEEEESRASSSGLDASSLFGQTQFPRLASEFVEFDLDASTNTNTSANTSANGNGNAGNARGSAHQKGGASGKKGKGAARKKRRLSSSSNSNSNSNNRERQTALKTPDSHPEAEEEEEGEEESSSESDSDRGTSSQRKTARGLTIITKEEGEEETPHSYSYDQEEDWGEEEAEEEEEGEWISAGSKRGSGQLRAKRSPSTATAIASAGDGHYLQLREQRLLKEQQRRKAYETAFLRGKLDHAPRGLKKVAPSESVAAKPVVGMTTEPQSAAPKRATQNKIKEMIRVGRAFAAAAAANHQHPSEATPTTTATATGTAAPEESEKNKNRQQFMTMMYSLLDRRNAQQKTAEERPLPSLLPTATDNDGEEHSSLTDTEHSDDALYQIDRNVVYPALIERSAMIMMQQQQTNHTSQHLLSEEEDEETLNKFYSIMNAYYHYQATESLIPWEQSSPSPEAGLSSEGYSLFAPPPLIPLTASASGQAGNTTSSPSGPPPPPPPPPPLLIPPPLSPLPFSGHPLEGLPLPPLPPIGFAPMMFPLPPPPPVYQSPAILLEATQKQIEYYFSAKNLEHDLYLRQLMDEEGYVALVMIAYFPRILLMNVPSETLLLAVQTSELLDVKVESPQSLLEGTKLSAEEMIDMTFIRCQDDPLQWVLPPSDSAEMERD